MVYGIIAFILAVIGAGWLLVLTARQNQMPRSQTNQHKKRSELMIKGIICLSLCAGLFAVNLWPLALMVLLSVGGVAAIEYWKQHSIDTRGTDSLLDSREKYSEQDGSFEETTFDTIKDVMSVEEARQVLGLEAGVDEQAIRASHRKLISKIHPDLGGNDYLASKINNARDVLLKSLI